VNSIDTVHISTNVVEIQYKIPAENAFEYLWVRWKFSQGRPYFSYGRKWNSIYACAVKKYITLEKRHGDFHVTEYIIRRFFIIGLIMAY
jgi:hypothetical protein